MQRTLFWSYHAGHGQGTELQSQGMLLSSSVNFPKEIKNLRKFLINLRIFYNIFKKISCLFSSEIFLTWLVVNSPVLKSETVNKYFKNVITFI
jgi:hypothetical protein